jgi:uroporphyrin-III C-methyltransferase/precorrin-2 dehydrogenase/sirohydrochlorin ferrochelatase
MGLLRVAEIASGLIERGLAAETPAALIESGTLPNQRCVTGTLANIAERTSDLEIHGPALIVVGRVVTLREGVRWFAEV